jgi:FkbM family methyltransferase
VSLSKPMRTLRDRVALIASHPRPVAFIASRILMRSGVCRVLTIPQDGFRLRFYPSSLSAALWVAPQSRQSDAAFFRGYLRPGDVVVDVGANIGSLAIAAALRVGPEGRVVAVEAHPRTAEFLRGNVALNGVTNVDVVQCALGPRAGRTRLTDRRSDDLNQVGAAAGIEVPVRGLDDLALPASEISLLKIDVEGYERPVLEGGARVLERTACVYFESWERHFARYGYHAADVLRLLADAGFTCLQRTTDGSLRVLASDHRCLERENLIAVRSIPRLCQRTGWAVGGHPMSSVSPPIGS